MKNQIHFEEIEIGQSIPSLVKHPTPRQLVMWAAASEEYYEVHYDKDFAQEKGLPGIIVHGMLQMSFLGQMITDWIGEWGTVKRIRTSNRAITLPNQNLICKGIVTKKYVENNENLVQCEMWLETKKGEKSVLGEALVSLPRNDS
jgi:hydroxyacyl-ACP dehydratase HTD2-like protein with hotdog domain